MAEATVQERTLPHNLEAERSVLGAILLPVCGLVTLTNFCIPSTLLGIWSLRRGTAVPTQGPDTT